MCTIAVYISGAATNMKSTKKAALVDKKIPRIFIVLETVQGCSRAHESQYKALSLKSLQNIKKKIIEIC